MANILINGLKSKVGGGKVIFDTYLRLLEESRPNDRYFILTPDAAAYRAWEQPHVTVVDVPGWAHSNLATLPLYHLILPRLLKRHAIDAILNFGDIVIPTDVSQVYNFDWAFAVYPESVVWTRLPRAERMAYRLKLHFFDAYLSRATTIMAQTAAMKARLEHRYGLDNVVLVPAAVSFDERATVGHDVFNLPKDRLKLVYPANYYPHKNIEILADVAALLKARGRAVSIVTTLAEDEHDGVRALLSRVHDQALDDMLVNVGRVPASRISALYEAIDGLLMPTLLETFGLPYVEAMYHGKPILTSDMDFARAVCGDAATYFDPLDAASIADAIEDMIDRPDLAARLKGRGADRLSQTWNWNQVFDTYQELLSQSLRRA